MSGVRKVNFISPSEKEAGPSNWVTLVQSTEQNTFDPFFGTTPATAGFTNVSKYQGYYYVWGPIVFFSIALYSATTVVWTATKALKLPFKAATNSDGSQLENGKTYPATAKGGGNATKDRFSFTDTKTLGAEAGNAGAGTNVNISGWYFRE